MCVCVCVFLDEYVYIIATNVCLFKEICDK